MDNELSLGEYWACIAFYGSVIVGAVGELIRTRLVRKTR